MNEDEVSPAIQSNKPKRTWASAHPRQRMSLSDRNTNCVSGRVPGGRGCAKDIRVLSDCRAKIFTKKDRDLAYFSISIRFF
jgi:hypothetical protein